MSMTIQINWPSNIIHICAISPEQIYSDIHLVNMWHPNIFWYSFTKLCGIQIYSDICLDPFYDIHSSLIFTQCATFISGNFCSLMTAKTWNISVVHCSLSLHSNHNLCKSTMHWCAACLISAYMAVKCTTVPWSILTCSPLQCT